MFKKLLFILALAFSLALLPNLAKAAVAGPNLISPANNAKNYNAKATMIYWARVSGATSYDVQLHEGDNDFVGTITVSGDRNYLTMGEASLGNGKTYYWRVRSKIGEVFSNWSGAYKFTTATVPATPILNFPIKKVVSVNNAYTTIYNNAPKDFSWKIVGSDVLFSKVIMYSADAPTTGDPSCGAEALNINVKGGKLSSNVLASLDDGYYCWKVIVYSNIGEKESTKNYFKFSSAGINPEPIFAQTGLNGALFYWTKTGPAPDWTYKFRVSLKSSMEDAIYYSDLTIPYNYQEVSSGVVYNLIKSNPGKTIYWQVANSGGDYTKVKSFKSNFLATPVITWPKLDTTIVTATSSVLKWVGSAGAKFYKVEVKNADNSFSKTYYSTGTSYAIPKNQGFSSNTSYSWSVTAYSDFAISTLSTPGAFKTK